MPTRRIRGIAPKKWFYGFRDHLRANAHHTRTVMAGSACEQWLNAEFAAWLASALAGTGFTVYPEIKKRDIVVMRVDPNNSVNRREPIAVVESKVVYYNYSEKKIDDYAKRLCEQVVSPTRFGAEPIQRVGLFWALYAMWTPDGDPDWTFRQFTSNALDGFRCAYSNPKVIDPKRWDFQQDHMRMETILEPEPVAVGDAKAFVGCAARWFQAWPRDV